LVKARKGLYPLDVSKRIPEKYLKKYCRKGVRDMTGTFLVDKKLREKTRFEYINLNGEKWPNIGTFDVIFLRNVMIYFDAPTKKRLIENMVDRLKPNGILFLGHSESLLGMSSALKTIQPAVYQKL